MKRLDPVTVYNEGANKAVKPVTLIVRCLLTVVSVVTRQFKSLSTYQPIARVDVDDIAFSSSLFSYKVDNTDGLNQLEMDAFGCMVQGSFLTHVLSRPSQS